MTTPNDGPGRAHSPAGAEWVELSGSLGGYLIDLLQRAFEIPGPDAEWMVRETFAEYCLDKPAVDARAWITAAACRRANGYRQRRGLPAADEAAVERYAEASRLTHEAMERLPSRAREALRLRYEENKTVEEIAAQLGLSVHAAKRFVFNALTRLRGLLDGEERRR